jgi:pimeloyl-ACP methyl ester carboxylesterase
MRAYERDGLTFDVRDAGPADGEVALLLHGFPQDGSAWDLVTPRLHAAGLRTLTPDQRGYSPRARPADRSAYRLREMVADTVALLDAAGVERAHLIGHDWGGAVVWAAVARHPDRFASAVVVSTPHPSALAFATIRSLQAMRSWYIGFFQLPVVPELALSQGLEYTLRASGLPAEKAAYYADRMREPGALTGALAWYRAFGASAIPRMLGPRRPSRPREARWSGPTTYLWGRGDVALGRTAAEHTARFAGPDCRFIELDGGHWLPETRPAAVADAVLECAFRR